MGSIKRSVEMTRGKVVEDAIRFSFSVFNPDRLNIKAAQSYANEDFLIKTIGYPKNLIISHAKSISSLVRSGIINLIKIGVKKFKRPEKK